MAVRTRAWLGASSRLAIRPKPQLSRSYELLQREGDGASIVRFPRIFSRDRRAPCADPGGGPRRQGAPANLASRESSRSRTAGFKPLTVGRLSYTITMRSIIPASKALASTDDDVASEAMRSGGRPPMSLPRGAGVSGRSSCEPARSLPRDPLAAEALAWGALARRDAAARHAPRWATGSKRPLRLAERSAAIAICHAAREIFSCIATRAAPTFAPP